VCLEQWKLAMTNLRNVIDKEPDMAMRARLSDAYIDILTQQTKQCEFLKENYKTVKKLPDALVRDLKNANERFAHISKDCTKTFLQYVFLNKTFHAYLISILMPCNCEECSAK
jgi:hypothetical protein